MDRIYTVESSNKETDPKSIFMLENMHNNLAFIYKSSGLSEAAASELLSEMKESYSNYRHLWKNQCLEQQSPNSNPLKLLCVDIETAAICDLACPFCYRQYEVTPDKVMEYEVGLQIIDQAAALDVPSIKFNWRGEPLLHKKLPELIKYAKSQGILETIINTNATRLDKELAEKLIDAGLDVLIFSFDGGTKETYESMRPGRFKENKFEDVYTNIRQFGELRNSSTRKFPFTRIQLVVTEKTESEIDSFKRLFSDIVDDVSTKQYTERGGKMTDLASSDRKKLDDHVHDDDYILKTNDGKFFRSVGRLPCEQPYQRLLVTYDGRVGMCCYDWGAKHPVGYVNEKAWTTGSQDVEKTARLIKTGGSAFSLLSNAVIPRVYNEPILKEESLEEIWKGRELSRVREAHCQGRHHEVEICSSCPFKDTYQWEEISLVDSE